MLDLAKFVEEKGPFTIKFRKTTIRFFAWGRKERNNPGCNVRMWRNGKEVNMQCMSLEDAEECDFIFKTFIFQK